LEVAPRNKISRREDKEIISAHVSHLAFSNDGEWMASIDKREDDEVDSSELYLKFWCYDHDLQS
jgi:NET1-associated nuclear protein 1 (U3 small nucleolar RNA-associated protein 17)